MKRTILLAVLMLTALGATTAYSYSDTVIADDLATAVSSATDETLIPTAILLHPEPDVQEMAEYLEGVRGDARKQILWQELKSRAETAQEDLLDLLYAEELNGRAGDIRPLVIANGIAVQLTPELIDAIAARPDVRAMTHVPEEVAIDPMPQTPSGGTDELDEIVWSIEQINAPAAWNEGYTGEGVLVAILDTGVNYNHLDLADHLWDGGVQYPNHGYDFYNNDNNPMDDNGHGSHVAGTAVGDGTAGSQTGVAPDATLMALKVFSWGGSGSPALVWQALDFCLQHEVDVLSMSAGWHNMVPTERATFRTHYETLVQAGIIATNSAGNDGDNQFSYPIPDNVKTPASVPAPWLSDYQTEPGEPGGVVTVGATDSNDMIAYFSSRGPCSWEDVTPWNDFIYANGSNQGLIKPDVSAPGVNIKSLDYSSNTGYADGWNGTSMSTPAVCGTIALILSAAPDLDPVSVAEVIQTTALELGPAGKDNSYGYGRIDAYEAVLTAQAMSSIVWLNIDPLYDPFILPGSGGNMQFDAYINNNLDNPTPGQVWTGAILPNGNYYHIQTYNITFQPGVAIDIDGATQYVPGWAPDGIYQFVVRVGQYPNFVVDEDQFEFRKFSWDPDATGDWKTFGLDELELQAGDEQVAVEDNTLPGSFSLSKPYPNPFNPATSLTLTLPDPGNVRVVVYDALGRQAAVLADGTMTAGVHQLAFDGTAVSSGVYFVEASFGNQKVVQKALLMK